jgi:hypothetical protein
MLSLLFIFIYLREYKRAFVAFRLVYICHRRARKVYTYSRLGKRKKNERTKGRVILNIKNNSEKRRKTKSKKLVSSSI